MKHKEQEEKGGLTCLGFLVLHKLCEPAELECEYHKSKITVPIEITVQIVQKMVKSSLGK